MQLKAEGIGLLPSLRKPFAFNHPDLLLGAALKVPLVAAWSLLEFEQSHLSSCR